MTASDKVEHEIPDKNFIAVHYGMYKCRACSEIYLNTSITIENPNSICSGVPLFQPHTCRLKSDVNGLGLADLIGTGYGQNEFGYSVTTFTITPIDKRGNHGN